MNRALSVQTRASRDELTAISKIGFPDLAGVFLFVAHGRAEEVLESFETDPRLSHLPITRS